MQLRTRFAPSPSGLLHVGNAFSALRCAQWADTNDADLLLRIEDIDYTRCRPEFDEAMLEDLRWLGLNWPEPVRRQQQQRHEYRQAIEKLHASGLIYPCFCTRRTIQQEWRRMGSAPHANDPAISYPGICRSLARDEQERRMQKEPFAWRLNVERALQSLDKPLTWLDEAGRSQPVRIDHDIVVGRKDIDFSYHLAVVIDDAAQGITHVIRGEDLLDSAGIHSLLQGLLDCPKPIYIHHPLLCCPDGERLAKRNQATTLRSLREMGVCPQKLQAYLLANREMVWPFAPNEREQILAALGID